MPSCPRIRTKRWAQRPGLRLWISLLFTFSCLLSYTSATNGVVSNSMIPPLRVSNSLLRDQAVGDSGQLECLEVVPPVLTPPRSATPCTQTLMEFSFQNSYGTPFVGQYQPPDCAFNRVIMNFTVTSSGRQFDRLAVMFLNDTEVWRTSTAEPTTAGIVWSYVKDMSAYLSLWKQPQAVIFDLGNIIDQNYTGPYNTTLIATFFNDSQFNETVPADAIIPVSARNSATGGASEFKVPDTQAINNLTIPRNAERAVFSLSACGQMAEEFWWSNVPDSAVATFGANNTLLGHSPFREVQLLIDGQLAGVSWPFPVIFTGGVVPGFWRPVVGIDAFDLREDEIDITAWLPLLSDGKDHSYEIRVMGLSDDGQGNAVLSSVGSYWVVTGKIFLWLDNTNTSTIGPAPTITNQGPQFFVTSTFDGSGKKTNTTLNYQVLAQRQFSVLNTITTGGEAKQVSWMQTLSYSNLAKFVANGNNQTTNMVISGADVSSSGYTRKFAYPLDVFNAFIVDSTTGTMRIDGTMDRSKNVQTEGTSVFPSPLDAYISQGPFNGWTITNRQNGTAFYFSDPANATSVASGTTEQELMLMGIPGSRPKVPQNPMGGSDVPLFSRHVLASNNSVITDSDPGSVLSGAVGNSSGQSGLAMSDFAMITAEDIVGGKLMPQRGN